MNDCSKVQKMSNIMPCTLQSKNILFSCCMSIVCNSWLFQLAATAEYDPDKLNGNEVEKLLN